ncbi:UNKNOWN [Stylonychia lemnae]|uniref:Uncharacterized protein n=1 Tax=Stylonychia lemnae TaxID=5949 RepID=A0A078A0E0_STYLE|nr:UNKNOWN [Stylonychia lemnae]|eukprot:CDW75615.1 UNKNOWN [Stylonychia lemnae]
MITLDDDQQLTTLTKLPSTMDKLKSKQFSDQSFDTSKSKGMRFRVMRQKILQPKINDQGQSEDINLNQPRLNANLRYSDDKYKSQYNSTNKSQQEHRQKLIYLQKDLTEDQKMKDLQQYQDKLQEQYQIDESSIFEMNEQIRLKDQRFKSLEALYSGLNFHDISQNDEQILNSFRSKREVLGSIEDFKKHHKHKIELRTQQQTPKQQLMLGYLNLKIQKDYLQKVDNENPEMGGGATKSINTNSNSTNIRQRKSRIETKEGIIYWQKQIDEDQAIKELQQIESRIELNKRLEDKELRIREVKDVYRVIAHQRQGRALDKYERFNKDWEYNDQLINQKIKRKQQSQSLINQQDSFRSKTEIRSILDRSKPDSLIYGSEMGWKMNLRLSKYERFKRGDKVELIRKSSPCIWGNDSFNKANNSLAENNEIFSKQSSDLIKQFKMNRISKGEREERLKMIKNYMPTMQKDQDLQSISLHGQNVLKKEKSYLQQLIGKDANQMAQMSTSNDKKYFNFENVESQNKQKRDLFWINCFSGQDQSNNEV